MIGPIRVAAAALGAVALVLLGLPLGVNVAIVTAAAIAMLPPAGRRHFVRGALRIVILAVAATAAMWVFIRVIPDSERVGRLPVGEALGEWAEWLAGALKGDLGFSRQYAESVNEGVARTVPISLQLAAYSQVLAVVIAVPAALISVRWHRSPVDRAVSTGSLVGISVPPIVVAPMLVTIFALGGIAVAGTQIGTEVFPAGRYVPVGDGMSDHIRAMTLPTVVLALSLVAPYVSILRSELLTIASHDYIQSAAARGLPARLVLLRHALPVALPRLIAAVAGQMAVLIGNMIIIERLFILPGFTDYVLLAITRRDLAPIAGGTLIIAGVLATIALFADALVVSLDPRRDDSLTLRGSPRHRG